MRPPIPACLLVVLAILAPAGAQDEKKAPVRTNFRVTRFDPADRPSPTFRVPSGADRIDVEVPLTHIAGPFKGELRDGKFLDFFEGNAERPALSAAIAPDQRNDLLLVFVPAKDGYHILPVHAPAAKIKGGDRYVVNATDADLAIQFGTNKPVLIAPGQPGLLRAPGNKQIETFPVVIKQRSADGWDLVTSEDWPCDPRFRSFLFIYRSPKSKHIQFHGVSDRL